MHLLLAASQQNSPLGGVNSTSQVAAGVQTSRNPAVQISRRQLDSPGAKNTHLYAARGLNSGR